MRIVFSFVFLVFCFIGGAYIAKQQLVRWGETPQILPTETIVKIPRGTSLRTLSGLLADQGVVDSSRIFQIWVRLESKYSEFQAGQYKFEGEVSPQMVASMIRSGEVYQPVVLEVTIPEGFRLDQIFKRYAALGVGSLQEFEQLAKDAEFLSSLGLPKPNLEGFFYPATYRYYTKPDPREVITKGVGVFFEKLPENYAQEVEEKGLSLFEAVTFASLIELETKYDDERSSVSEVIWRRYKDGVALAIDASIIYGVKNYDGNLRRRDLRDTSNPYNTRVHRGLPPGPIGAPSLASLKAVLTPSDNGYYYYVVDAAHGDRHHFSKSLKEHNVWVRKLVKAQREARRSSRAKEREQRALEYSKRRKERAEQRRQRRANQTSTSRGKATTETSSANSLMGDFDEEETDTELDTDAENLDPAVSETLEDDELEEELDLQETEEVVKNGPATRDAGAMGTGPSTQSTPSERNSVPTEFR